MSQRREYYHGEVLNEETGTIFLAEAPKHGKTRYAQMQCGNCGRIYTAAIGPAKRGRTCAQCKGQKISKAKSKKIYQIGEIINQDTGSILLEIISGDRDIHSYGRILCGYCGSEYIARIDHVKAGHCCNNCRSERIADTLTKYHEGDIISSRDGMFQYLFVKELPSDKEYRKGIFKLLNAPDGIQCKEIFYSTLSSILYTGAHGGNLSYSELRFGQILESLDIPYIWQYSFENLVGENKHKLSFDFMIPLSNNQKLLVEIDGEQHDRPIDFFGGQTEFERQQKRDKQKENFVDNDANLFLLRLPYQQVKKISQQDIKQLLFCYDIDRKGGAING